MVEEITLDQNKRTKELNLDDLVEGNVLKFTIWKGLKSRSRPVEKILYSESLITEKTEEGILTIGRRTIKDRVLINKVLYRFSKSGQEYKFSADLKTLELFDKIKYGRVTENYKKYDSILKDAGL